jgi:hypothetical protein
MKKHVSQGYYGRRGKNSEKDEKKGTAFENCELPADLYNVNRRVKMNIKQTLSRLGF